MSTTTHSTTAIFDSSIGYDRITKDYAIYLDGEVIAYAPSYREAEQLRTAALARRIPDNTPSDDFDDVPAGEGEPQRCPACCATLPYADRCPAAQIIADAAQRAR